MSSGMAIATYALSAMSGVCFITGIAILRSAKWWKPLK